MSESELYLTVDNDPKGDGLIAIISKGHPRLGDEEVVICDVNRVYSKAEADEWFKQQCITRPWEARS